MYRGGGGGGGGAAIIEQALDVSAIRWLYPDKPVSELEYPWITSALVQATGN